MFDVFVRYAKGNSFWQHFLIRDYKAKPHSFLFWLHRRFIHVAGSLLEKSLHKQKGNFNVFDIMLASNQTIGA
jgi:hypothetical protein